MVGCAYPPFSRLASLQKHITSDHPDARAVSTELTQYGNVRMTGVGFVRSFTNADASVYTEGEEEDEEEEEEADARSDAE